jgi:hypothetical protein
MLDLGVNFLRKPFVISFQKHQVVYVSIFRFKIFTGMDAQVAYGFHHLRNEKPYLAQGPIANKVLTIKLVELFNAFLHTKFLTMWFLLLKDENRDTCFRFNMHELHSLGLVFSNWCSYPLAYLQTI